MNSTLVCYMQNDGGTRYLLYNNVLTKISKTGSAPLRYYSDISFSWPILALRSRGVNKRSKSPYDHRGHTDGSVAQELILFPASC